MNYSAKLKKFVGIQKYPVLNIVKFTMLVIQSIIDKHTIKQEVYAMIRRKTSE